MVDPSQDVFGAALLDYLAGEQVPELVLGDLNDPPADLPWAGVLLLCGNLGLGGSSACVAPGTVSARRGPVPPRARWGMIDG